MHTDPVSLWVRLNFSISILQAKSAIPSLDVYTPLYVQHKLIKPI
jgi:hypothetical protein